MGFFHMPFFVRYTLFKNYRAECALLIDTGSVVDMVSM